MGDANQLEFSVSTSTIDMICVFLLSIILICSGTQGADNEGETCYQVYECCRKEDTDCLEYCGPNVECIRNSEDPNQVIESTEAAEAETTQPTEEIEITTQKIAIHQVILVGTCRVGFKPDSTGKCRRKL